MSDADALVATLTRRMTRIAATALLPLVLLAGCHEPGHTESTGGGGNGCFLGICPQEPQRAKPKAQCVPPVAWARPGAGTVTDIKTCPGLFGTEMRYIRVDSGPRQVWLADPGGSCRVGDRWGPTSC